MHLIIRIVEVIAWLDNGYFSNSGKQDVNYSMSEIGFMHEIQPFFAKFRANKDIIKT